MPDIIHTTLAVIALPGITPRAASRLMVDSLNADLGTAYDTARLGQWRRGERTIPQPVQDWMLRVSVCYAIRQCGGSAPTDEADIDRLAAMLSPPGASSARGR